MSRHLLGFLFVLTLAPTTGAIGGVGIFEATEDIPGVGAAGTTEFVGMVEKDRTLVEQYRITGYGNDIGGVRDQFHFAHRTLRGDWRVSADVEWVGNPPDYWAEAGVMIRASNAGNAAHYNTVIRNDVGGNNRTDTQWRPTTGANSSEQHVSGQVASRMGIQRVLIGGEIPAIESIADFGGGWERIGTLKLLPDIPDEALLGVCVTSHTVEDSATALVTDVVYERAEMVGAAPPIVLVPPGAAKQSAPTNRNGFVVRTMKATNTDGWDRTAMNKLLDFGCTGPLCLGPDMPIPGVEAGLREVPFVNLHDTGDRGAFTAGNGYSDQTFPGIDPFESPTAEPAAGDDDDNFATEVMAVIHLTAGLHVIGVNDDEGTIVEIGGVEIGRSTQWKGLSNTDFILDVRQEGFYTLRARHLEGDGGAALELHEIVETADGSWKRILLGDVANGGSAVYIPDPATIILLGLGGLALVRRKRA